MLTSGRNRCWTLRFVLRYYELGRDCDFVFQAFVKNYNNFELAVLFDLYSLKSCRIVNKK